MSAVPVLTRLLQATRRRLEESKRRVPESVLRAKVPARAPRDLAKALCVPGPSVIAEVKRASPSKGDLAPGLDAAACAYEYEDHGAAAVSVLTEPEFFKGSLDDLAAARAAVDVPLLRKDFIVDPYQLLEARVHGADAVLLIVAALCDEDLRGLLAEAKALGLSALVEVRSEAELDRALAAGARLIGINNRDLDTLAVDPSVAPRLAPKAKAAGAVVVGESGVDSPEGLKTLHAAGCDAALVGTALTRSGRPGAALARLLGRPAGTRVKVCGVTRAEDAYKACSLGAWAVGLVFAPGSPSTLTAEAAVRAAQGVGGGALKVGVFQDQPEAEVRRLAEAAALDLVQLHGAETDLYAEVAGLARCVKTVTLGGPRDVDAAARRG
ncbi:MAG: indole-3-glycerol phosphate synthase TrpC, partial [Elusimicrobia bacterium]|nr:indole-3-glycerol phosphate synthase TrpC [Elusimicrobiota bacterium]